MPFFTSIFHTILQYIQNPRVLSLLKPIILGYFTKEMFYILSIKHIGSDKMQHIATQYNKAIHINTAIQYNKAKHDNSCATYCNLNLPDKLMVGFYLILYLFYFLFYFVIYSIFFSFFFSCKVLLLFWDRVFPFQNNPKTPDPPYKMDIFLGLF